VLDELGGYSEGQTQILWQLSLPRKWKLASSLKTSCTATSSYLSFTCRSKQKSYHLCFSFGFKACKQTLPENMREANSTHGYICALNAAGCAERFPSYTAQFHQSCRYDQNCFPCTCTLLFQIAFTIQK
jgi:hypothetical protein